MSDQPITAAEVIRQAQSAPPAPAEEDLPPLSFRLEPVTTTVGARGAFPPREYKSLVVISDKLGRYIPAPDLAELWEHYSRLKTAFENGPQKMRDHFRAIIEARDKTIHSLSTELEQLRAECESLARHAAAMEGKLGAIELGFSGAHCPETGSDTVTIGGASLEQLAEDAADLAAPSSGIPPSVISESSAQAPAAEPDAPAEAAATKGRRKK